MPASNSLLPRRPSLPIMALAVATVLAAVAPATPARADALPQVAVPAEAAARRAVEQNLDLAVRRQLQRQALQRQAARNAAEAGKAAAGQPPAATGESPRQDAFR